MRGGGRPGWAVILNGAPRSGKSSIARALAEIGPGRWANHGVDAVMAATPAELLPGIGLRPGGERPDLEPRLPEMFEEMYAEIARLARTGVNVAVDVGHHDDYSSPLGILERVDEWLSGIPTLRVGVHCELGEIMRRRDRDPVGYVGTADDGSVPDVVVRWQHAVHVGWDYDVDVDTTRRSAVECARAIAYELGSR